MAGGGEARSIDAHNHEGAGTGGGRMSGLAHLRIGAPRLSVVACILEVVVGRCGMSSWVRYSPEDRVLDLANLSRSDYELTSSLEIVRGKRTLFSGGERRDSRIRLISDFEATRDVPPICAG